LPDFGPPCNAAKLRLDTKPFLTIDKLLSKSEPGDDKDVVLGLILLQETSDTFDATRAEPQFEEGADSESRKEYLAETVLWVPKELCQFIIWWARDRAEPVPPHALEALARAERL
jgi:hypothetical protein